MNRRISQWISVLLFVILSACNLPQSSEAAIPISGGARTWFDAPLDGSNLPLAPYPVVIHAYDPGGVAQIEFSVNGEVLGNLKPSSRSGLSQVDYTWEPKTTGNFALRARSQAQAGSWNSDAQVNVTIGELTPTVVGSFTPTVVGSFTPTPVGSYTPTAVASFTPTAVASFTPTVVASFTPTQVSSFTPTQVPPTVLTFTPDISATQIFYGNCGTNQVTIQALVSNPAIVKNITIFMKVKDQSSGTSTAWDEGEGMSTTGNGWFKRTVSATSIPNYNTYTNSWVLYQFVATGSDNSIVGRSQVYSDIALSSCGAAEPIRPPKIGITPIRPPVLIVPPVRKVPTIK